MRNIYSISVVLFLIVFSSCEKEKIPAPNVLPPLENTSNLFVKGNFNGEVNEFIIDGETYLAESNFFEGFLQPDLGAWEFGVKDNTGAQRFSFFLVNHDNDPVIDYSDLVQTTSGQALELYYDGIVDPTSSIYVVYFDPSEIYHSSPFVQVPLEILESKDTIVDNQSYRILEFRGDILMEDGNAQTGFAISDFHARLALSL